MTPKNTVCIWYDKDALEAARFYAATFPNSEVIAVHKAPTDYPSGKEGDVLTVEFTVLSLVASNADVTQKQLSQALAVSAPNITTLLDRLEQRQLLTRVRSEADRRSQHIRLTRKGNALARKATEVSRTMEQDVLRHLTEAEQAILVELLQKVARHRRV